MIKNLIEQTLHEFGEKPLDEIIDSVCSDPALHVYKKRIKAEINGFGPIEDLLAQDDITEVCINKFNKIYIEQEGLLKLTDLSFCSSLTYQMFVQNILLKIEKTADTRHPLVDGKLSCGTRIHVSLPPISENPVVTIRKHSFKNWTLADLRRMNAFSSSLDKLLETWILQKKNILFCGPTSTGKTTLLRAALKQCDARERIISIEDTPELGSIGSHHVNLNSRNDPEELTPPIDLAQLLKHSMRMRPDRLVVGEVRGEEAVVLLDALATGHRGSFCTLHADNAQHALARLESLVVRACPKWDLAAIRQLIKDSIDIIVVCQKRNGLRVISQTAQIVSVESFGYLLDSTNY